jgi:hexulose-6-phosphate isomerase
MNPIGIMQGRLSWSRELQAFPWSTWRQEFHAARAVGFQLIEWLFDAPRYGENPWWSPQGRQEIRELIAETGIGVRSVCAHYVINGQLSARGDAIRAEVEAILTRVIAGAGDVGADIVVLPLAEGASLAAADARDRALDVIARLERPAREARVRIALELDLTAALTLDVLRPLDPAVVGACYDLGNASAAGRRPSAELTRLHERLFEVHVKDRRRDGPNVRLGKGAVDFRDVSEVLRRLGYAGPLVLETPRGDHPTQTALEHLEFVRRYFAPESRP